MESHDEISTYPEALVLGPVHSITYYDRDSDYGDRGVRIIQRGSVYDHEVVTAIRVEIDCDHPCPTVVLEHEHCVTILPRVDLLSYRVMKA